MREFLMLAQTYKGQKIDGWYMSEKMDGMRAWWDGGVSRGKDSRSLPWANNAKSSGISTGLWSRYGNIIYAPSAWLGRLPPIPLDGELWMGRGSFQETMSVCRSHVPDDRWNHVKYCVFDSPSYDAVFTSGRINGVNCKLEIKLDDCLDAIGRVHHAARNFESVIELFDSMQWSDVACPVTQYKARDWDTVTEYCDLILSLRGEGVMVRHPGSYWCPNRSSLLLKVKPYQDAEGFIVGWEPGNGKYEGMLGALLIQWGKVQFALSGFTDAERALNADGPSCFKLGEAVTFKYRELTDSGVPKEARYYRKFDL